MTSHRLARRSVHRSLRRALPAATLVLLAGGLAACTGDDPAEDPAADATSETATPTPEPDATEPEETEETEEITPPGAQLAFDESALVDLPYPGEDTSGVFRISLDAIETAPLSLLDRAGVPQPTEPSVLYLVRQTFELVDPGDDNPGLASLIGHTQMLDAEGLEAEDINADVPGCEFDSFLDDDQPGQERKACNAFVLPRSTPAVNVTYLTPTKEYDKLQGGDFIYWPVEGVTSS